MIVEDFDYSNQLSNSHIDHTKQQQSIGNLFQRKELPAFDLQNLRTPNKFSSSADYRFLMEVLERSNKIPDAYFTQINWRQKSQTNTFIYNSLMAILFQPEGVGAKSIAELASWYRRTNKAKKCVIPQLKVTQPSGKEESLIRKTFKSSLPASIQKMTRRIYLDRAPPIKQAFNSQRDSEDKVEAAWDRCQTRLYQNDQKRLKSQREQGQINEQRQEAILSRLVLLEKLASTNLLYNSSVLNSKPVVGVSTPNAQSVEKLNEEAIRSLKTVHVTRRYQALKVDRPRKSSLNSQEKLVSKLCDIQGLTLMQSPLFKRKVVKIR